MMKSTLVLFAALLLAGPAPALAQPVAERPVTLYELVLRDGSKLYGAIEREDADEVIFRTESGASVTARRTEIMKLRKVAGSITDGEFQAPDPNATRLFFGPTGRTLAKGQTYLGVYEFIMPFVQVGVTDRLSIGGGTPLLFGFDESERPFWVTPKLQIASTASTQVAVGVFHAFAAGESGGGVGYVVATHGGVRNSVTAGVGVAYAVGDDGRSAVMMVGGERQVRRNLKLVTENYLWKGGNGFATAGIRFFGERLSADLGLAVPIGADDLFAFPMLNFVYMF